MTDEGEPLFKAVKEALSRSVPHFDHVGVGRRVREAYAESRTPPRPRPGAFGLALTGGVLALMLGLLIAYRGFSATRFEVAGGSGRVGSLLEAQPSQPLPLVFSEGSRVSLSAGSRGRVTEVTAQGARVELERGSVTADVVHRANSKWTFVAGPFEVAVLGTRLGVTWSPQARQFELRVASGAVRVRGPLVPHGREVRTGQVFRIDLEHGLVDLGTESAQPAAQGGAAQPQQAAPAPSTASPSAVSGTAVSGTAVSGTAVSGTAAGSGIEPQKPAWMGLAQAGKSRAAIALAERAGLPSVYRSSSPDSLLELARAARLSGRPDIERAALLECRQRARGQSSAAQAAYLLGRASAPAEAVSWFETYLREQPRGLMAREAAGRLIESYVASRNTESARRAAAKYLGAYPSGPHAAMAREVLGSNERP